MTIGPVPNVPTCRPIALFSNTCARRLDGGGGGLKLRQDQNFLSLGTLLARTWFLSVGRKCRPKCLSIFLYLFMAG